MKITKRQLKRIIREEYTRLKRKGLIREMQEMQLPAHLADLEQQHDQILSIMNGQAQGGFGGDDYDMRQMANDVIELEEEMHLEREAEGLPPKDYVAYSHSKYFHAENKTPLDRYRPYRQSLYTGREY